MIPEDGHSNPPVDCDHFFCFPGRRTQRVRNLFLGLNIATSPVKFQCRATRPDGYPEEVFGTGNTWYSFACGRNPKIQTKNRGMISQHCVYPCLFWALVLAHLHRQTIPVCVPLPCSILRPRHLVFRHPRATHGLLALLPRGHDVWHRRGGDSKMQSQNTKNMAVKVTGKSMEENSPMQRKGG